MVAIFLVAILFLILGHSCQAIKVFSTTNNLSDFQSCSGAKLLFPKEKEFGDISLCLRFLEYQVLSKTLIGSQDELSVGQNKIWENVEDISRNEYTFKIVETSFSTSWYFRHWNHMCLSFHNDTSLTLIVGNGKILLEDKDQRSRRRPLSTNFLSNLRLMAKSEDCKNVKNSFLGQITDVNIWKKALSLETLISWTNCENHEKGDVVNWNDDSWVTWGGVAEKEMKMSEICQTPGKVGLTLFPLLRTAEQSLDLCEALGGKIAVAKKKDDIRKMINLVQDEPDYCPVQRGNVVLAGFTDMEKEGVFVDMNTGKEMQWNDWGDGQPNDSGGEDCIALKDYGVMNDKRCELKMCTICVLKNSPVFNLRGSCPGENLDMTYTMMIDSRKDGRYEILGLSTTKLIWDEGRWIFLNMLTGGVIAFTEDTIDYPIGTHNWYFEDKKCSDPGEKWRKMNLHQACGDEKYACRNGFCISSKHKCDGNFDCKDFSDEINCRLVNSSLTPNYDKNNPPPIYKFNSLKRFGNDGKTIVFVDFQILKFIEVNEIDSSFSIQFKLTLKWKDPRLEYNFLKSAESENIIQNETWSPKINFLNFRRSLSENADQILVLKEGKPTKNRHEEIDMKETYNGMENSLMKNSIYQAQFNCFFTFLNHYPFDSEYCSIDMVMEESAYNFTYIQANKVIYRKDDVSGYSVIKVKMVETDLYNKKGIKVTVQLDRDIINILLSTYLPTLLMIIINQISNHFGNEDYFDTIITVNLTCMMVISALYISITGSLPITTTIKMVDVWLLFSLVYPFLVVLINSYIHYLRIMKTKEETVVYPVMQNKSIKEFLKHAFNLVKIPICTKTKIKVASFGAKFILPFFGSIFAAVYFYFGMKSYFDDQS